jgi:hypothetical protein
MSVLKDPSRFVFVVRRILLKKSLKAHKFLFMAVRDLLKK